MSRRPKGHCTYCKREMLPGDAKDGKGRHHERAFSRDHVTAKSHGGSKVVPCCRACNTVKADLTADQWSKFMQLNPRWWTIHPHTAKTRGIKPW